MTNYHLQTLFVLREAEAMLKDLGIEYKHLAEKALSGMMKDLEAIEAQTTSLTKILEDAATTPQNEEEERRKATLKIIEENEGEK